MEKENLIHKRAKLPDGRQVTIENIQDGVATVRRVDGPRAGTIAVCPLSKLEISDVT